MTEAEFEVEIRDTDSTRFAELSGDWNPLHTDPAYAKQTSYRRPILHGAFSAGLVSRMAGMHIPGRDCLLHSIKLRFIAPIVPPASVRVVGTLVRETGDSGLVTVFICDKITGIRYVEASYEFGHHQQIAALTSPPALSVDSDSATILVTGASGGLGSALLGRLGERGLGVTHSGTGSALRVDDLTEIPDLLAKRRIAGIVHCGWPAPDNQRLLELGCGTDAAIDYHVAAPLIECVKLAQILAKHGLPGAPLLLVGSTFAQPGRHNWRMPLYSLAKSLIPTLTKILAMELGKGNQRCVGVVFDVVEGLGMNATMGNAVRLSHADRSPSGKLATADQAAEQIIWILDNKSTLISGALITLSGGALP